MQILGNETSTKSKTGSGFQFSNTPISKLGATDYTVVLILVDMSGSVTRWARDLEKCVAAIVKACRHSPRAENLLLRIVGFNDVTFEVHGFVELTKINATDYDGKFNPDGSTALYDALLNGVESVKDFSEDLAAKDIFANALIVCLTDGDENASSVAQIGTPSGTDPKAYARQKIGEVILKIQRAEVLESLKTILVGVADPNSPDGKYLQDLLKVLKDEAHLDEFVMIGDASKSTLAKLAGFVSQSISSSSQALGTGGPSKPIQPASVAPIDLNAI